MSLFRRFARLALPLTAAAVAIGYVAAGSSAATLGSPNSPGVTAGASRDTLVLTYRRGAFQGPQTPPQEPGP